MSGKKDQQGNSSHRSSRYMTGTDEATALTRLELAILRVHEAFGRWAVELHKLSEDTPSSVGFSDIALLHCIRMRGHDPSVSELLHFLNRHDIANIQYSVKKLTKYGLVETCAGSSKRESRISLTKLGTELTDQYAKIRNEVLITLLRSNEGAGEQLSKAALALEHLVGIYDQATHSALNRHILGAP